MKKIKDKKTIIAIIASVIAIILVTGITYAWFSYTRNGTTENTISTEGIKFHYQEQTRGILLEDAMPMTDAQGKALTGEGNIFDFTITGKTGRNIDIPYVVTARVDSSSTLSEEAVKVYLTDWSNNEIEGVRKVSELTTYTNANLNITSAKNEKVLYEGLVLMNRNNYEKNFRLRMWVSDDAVYQQDITGVCTDTTYTTKEACMQAGENWTDTATNASKTFKIRVNVYSNGESISDALATSRANTNIDTLNIGASGATATDSTHYTADVLIGENEESTTTINVATENPNATVTIQKVDSLGAIIKETGIKPVSVSKTVTITKGLNYFKITVRPEDKSDPTIYYLTINCVDEIAGLFDDSDQLIASWSELTSKGFNIQNPTTNNSNSVVLNQYTNGKKLVIPSNSDITKIANNAFYYVNYVEHIEISNNINEVDLGAFDSCANLKEITLPSTVTTITNQNNKPVCVGCNQLTAININSGNYHSIDGVLYSNDMKTIYKYPQAKSGTSYSISSGVTTIFKYSFSSNKLLNSLVIPDSVTLIDDNAFSYTTISSFNIPSSVKRINNNAFNGSTATSIIFNEGLERIGNYALANTKITSLTIPETVTYLGGYILDSSSVSSVTFLSPDNWKRACSGSSTTCKEIHNFTNPTSNATKLKTNNQYGFTKAS